MKKLLFLNLLLICCGNSFAESAEKLNPSFMNAFLDIKFNPSIMQTVSVCSFFFSIYQSQLAHIQQSEYIRLCNLERRLSADRPDIHSHPLHPTLVNNANIGKQERILDHRFHSRMSNASLALAAITGFLAYINR